MSVHPDPELLAAVASGEPETPELSAHLAGCSACAADLAALRELSEGLAGLEPVEWAEPGEAVWAGVREAVANAATTDDGSRRAPGPRPANRARWWVAVGVAAALGILAGVVGGRLWWPGAAQPVVVASATLDTLTDQRTLGQANLLDSNGQVELSVRTQPLDPGPGYLEVWLLNTDGVRMVSLGVLADDSTGVFPVSLSLLQGGYRIVDISREAFDDKPTHSGDSIVRGELHL